MAGCDVTEKIYDIFINGKGYRLVDGPSALTSNIGTPLAAKVVTGDYSLSDFDLYSVIGQGSFMGGIGQLRLKDVTQYLWGHRIDARGEYATLGPKLDSIQPDSSRDHARTVSRIDVQAGLNRAIANEPENQNLAWLELSPQMTHVAIPFATAGGTPGDPDTPFSPADIPGLKLWLKGDVGVFKDTAGTDPVASDGDTVVLWKDQSAEGNDFVHAGSTCKYVADATNGHPGVRGDGSVNGYLKGLAPVSGNSPRTICLLLSVPVLNDGVGILDFGYQSGPWSGEDFYLTQYSQMFVEDGWRYWSQKPTAGAVQVLTLRLTGNDVEDMEMWIDGVKSAVQSTNTQALDTAKNNDTATLFCRNAATVNRFGKATILEVLAYDTSVDDAELENLHTYLETREAALLANPAPRLSAVDDTISRIWMYLRSRNKLSAASVIKFAIYDDAGGHPGAAVADGEVIIHDSYFSYYGKWISGQFSSSPALPELSSFWLVLDASALVDGENIEILTGQNAHLFPETYSRNEDGTWVNIPQYTALIAAQQLNKHPDTPVIKFIEILNHVYALAGRRLYRILDVSTVETVSDANGPHALAADAEDMMIVHKAASPSPSMLIALGAGTPMELWDGDVGWTVLGAEEHANRLCLHDNLWWRASQNDTDGVFVQGTLDHSDWVLAGTAGAKGPVGDNRFPGLQLFSWKGQLYVAKIDGLYIVTYADTYPADGAKIQANRILSLESEINHDNFRAMAIWQEDLYFSLASGVAQFTAGNVFASVTPDAALLEQERKRGRYVGFLPTLTYLYAFYESDVGDWSQILSYSGAWHSLMTMDRTGDLGGALFADSGLYADLPRIWTSSMCALTSFVQPTWTSRRWTFAEDSLDSHVEFFDRASLHWFDECEGRLYTSWIDGDLVNISKDWVDLDVVVDNIDPTEYYIEVRYRFDESAAWALLGRADNEPVTKLSFPGGTVARKIQLRFDFFTNETHNSPYLLGFALRYVARPDTTEISSVQVVISDELELHNNSIEPRTGAKLWEDLNKARDAKESVDYVDLFGRQIRVHISALSLQLGVRKEENRSKTNDSYIAVVQLTEA